MPRVPEKLQNERRNKLITIATRLFLQKGYGDTTIDEIIQELKFGKGTFYYHFRSKDELMVAVCQKIVSDLGKQLENIRDMRDRPIEDRIHALMKSLYNGFHNNQDIWFYLYQENNVILYEHTIRIGLNIMAPIIAEILDDGIRQGLFKIPHAMEAAKMIIIMFDFYCKQYVRTDDNAGRERYRMTLEHFLEHTLGIGPAPTGIL